MDAVVDEQLVLDEEAASWRDVDGEVVVRNLATSAYLSLNGTGSHLWPMLVRGTTVKEMADELVRSFGVDESDAVVDAAAFARAVADQRILRPVAALAR